MELLIRLTRKEKWIKIKSEETVMKKIIILIFLIMLSVFIFAEGVSITDINSPEELKGNTFFPLFVGAKWVWDIKGMGELTRITWEITSAHIINDNSNDMNNIMAFKIEAKELNDNWYLMEHDGYICSYKKTRNKYKIERILPINPQLEDNWMDDDNHFSIVAFEENMLKVELINEEDDIYGYQMFILNVGPYEIFQYMTILDEQQDLRMTLIDNVSYEDMNKKSEEIDSIKSETEETKIIETESAELEEIEPETEPLETDTIESSTAEIEDIESDAALTETFDSESTELDTIETDAIESSTAEIEDIESDTRLIETIDTETVEAFDSETKESDIIEIEEKKELDVTEDDYIDSLSKGKKYIQIGAFSVVNNAHNMLIKAKDLGYKAKIYKDSYDDYNKILIEITDSEDRILKDIRKTIASDAFMKQR